jgi:hypothetical protein
VTRGEPLVFDSYNLLKLFQKETGYEEIVHILDEARKTHTSLFIANGQKESKGGHDNRFRIRAATTTTKIIRLNQLKEKERTPVMAW